MIEDYAIVSNGESGPNAAQVVLVKLYKEVFSMIKQGYEPIGGVSITATDRGFCAAQALIKRSKDGEQN